MAEPGSEIPTVATLTELLQQCFALVVKHNTSDLWWRGHGSADWTLIPGVYRHGRGPRYEKNVSIHFVRRAHTRYAKCPADTDLPGWLFLMQHHRLPTRLLDWTASCLVATFFAVTAEPNADGALWVLNPFAFNGSQVGDPRLVSASGDDAAPIFRPVFMDGQKDVAKILALFASEVDTRMLIQQSSFTIHGTATPIEQLPGAAHFCHKLIVPVAAKPILRWQLRLLGISLHTLFPDLEHLAEDLRDLVFPELDTPTPSGDSDKVKE